MPDEEPPGPKKEKVERMQGRRRKAHPCTPLSVARALREWPELHTGRMFRHDTFSGETLMVKVLLRPEVEPPASWDPVPVTDIHITWLLEVLEHGGMTKPTRTTVDNAVQAEGDRNRFSAAVEQLESLPAWDGVVRLDHFWVEVCGAEAAPEGFTEDQVFRRIRYLSATARAFFISIVARIKMPGEKVDTVVILEGPQGGFKSTLLRVIAFDRNAWFSDSMSADLKHKDARSHLAGKVIVELAELLSVKGSTVEGVKAFLSASDDKFRPSYGRRDVIHPRQCVFVGTTNSDRYLADVTGNRRFWPIKVGRIDIDKARALMPQLYAEALDAYGDGSGDGIKGEPWHLDDKAELFAAEEQEDRRVLDPLEEFIGNKVEELRRAAIAAGQPTFFVATGELQESTEAGTGVRWNEGTAHRIGRILAKLGGINRRLHPSDRDRKRGYIFRCS